MSGRTVKRVTLSLPPKALSDLDFVSSSLGVSRSAFVSALLSEVLPPLIPLSQIVSKTSSEADSKRYRGDFMTELDGMVRKLNSDHKGLQDDLFKE